MNKLLLVSASAAALVSSSAFADTLFDQTTTTGAYDNRFISQIFSNADGSEYGGAYDSATVDDFTLTSGAHLSQVMAAVVGYTAGFKSFDDVQRYDVNIYSSLAAAAGNLTGDVYHFSVAAPKLETDVGAFTITGPTQSVTIATANVFIPIDVSLDAGTYFLSVIATNDDGTNGQTAIATSHPGDAVITNPGGGFYPGATNPAGLGQGAGYRIDGTVPEPATWAMMLAGFGLVGAGLRRRSGRMVQAV